VTDDLLYHFRAVRREVVKWAHYFPVYERLLCKYRGTAVTLVEVGVGDGGSLEGWRGYLGPSARIIGIDLDPAAARLRADGFEIIIGNQSHPEFWAEYGSRIGPVDVLIDDGGHSSVDQIVTVACGLPHIRDGGVIVIEDTHTSYMQGDYPAAARYGFMQFAAHVVDVLHARNPMVTDRIPDSAGLGRAIHSVEFFESLVIFHVDRRLCGPAVEFDAGVPAAAAPNKEHRLSWRAAVLDGVESRPAWMPELLEPLRRVLGGALRAAARRARARRVRQYFR
jgi:hypothetical protein